MKPSFGLNYYKLVSAASTNATALKAAPGRLHGWIVSNVNAAVRYLKFYDLAVAPTVGTSVPVLTIALQGGATGPSAVYFSEHGIAFNVGIAFATTTEATDAGSTGISANESVINLIYS